MTKLVGAVAVVTGAGSGIGRATSLALANKGCYLALADVNQEGMAQTAAQLASLGAKVSQHQVDVSNKEQMAALPGEVEQTYGRINVLVNNAGVELTTRFEEQSLEDFEWIVGINFWGVIYGCQFFLPILKRQKESHIVNVSSMFGFYGVPSQSSYCATKFAVRGFTESLRAEMKGTNVGVTCIHPGAINTNIMRNEKTLGTQMESQSSKFMRYATAPEKVANKIVHGIEKNKRRVRIGPDSYLSDWLTRLTPTGFNQLMSMASKALSST